MLACAHRKDKRSAHATHAMLIGGLKPLSAWLNVTG